MEWSKSSVDEIPISNSSLNSHTGGRGSVSQSDIIPQIRKYDVASDLLHRRDVTDSGDCDWPTENKHTFLSTNERRARRDTDRGGK